MVSIKVLILDEDPRYAAALARRLALTNKEFDVSCADFEDRGPEDQGPKRIESFHLFLIGDRREKKEGQHLGRFSEIVKANRNRCILLTRETAIKEPGCFYRYGRVSEVAALMKVTYGKNFGRSGSAMDFTGRTQLTAFLSGAGGTGRTASAIACCRMLSREYGKTILYLNFEEWSSQDFYVKTPQPKHELGEFLYYLCSCENRVMGSWLSAYLFKDSWGVSYLFPPAGPNELAALKEEELIQLFKTVLQYGEFDHIILDLSFCLKEEASFLIRSCKNIVLISDHRRFSHEKNRRLSEWLANDRGFCQEGIWNLQLDWESSNFMEMGEGEEIHLCRSLGREVKEIAERLVQ